MEQKLIRVPFDVELAKEITNGTKEGRIIRKDGARARIVCWDYKSLSGEYPLLVLVENGIFEVQELYTSDGCFKSFKNDDKCDLVIEIPERLENVSFQFKPFDKVLVRDEEDDKWGIELFERYSKDEDFPYICLVERFKYCIPYNEKTAHLIGTTENWEGEL